MSASTYQLFRLVATWRPEAQRRLRVSLTETTISRADLNVQVPASTTKKDSYYKITGGRIVDAEDGYHIDILAAVLNRNPDPLQPRSTPSLD